MALPLKRPAVRPRAAWDQKLKVKLKRCAPVPRPLKKSQKPQQSKLLKLCPKLIKKKVQTRKSQKSIQKPGQSKQCQKSKQAATIYTRTSSKKSADKLQVSHKRQVMACEALLKQLKPGSRQKKLPCVTEVCSGTLPLSQRHGLQALFTQGPGKVLMESARALARKATVAEDIWEQSKASGIKLEASDLPGLLKHWPTPAEGFIRKVMFAMYEFEKDLIVMRLVNGLQQKKDQESQKLQPRRGQQGQVKVNGRLSLLERRRPNSRAHAKICQACAAHRKGDLSARQLASALTAALGLERPMAMETARRMAQAGK